MLEFSKLLALLYIINKREKQGLKNQLEILLKQGRNFIGFSSLNIKT